MGKQGVEQVAELVEDRLDLAVSEQGGGVADGGRHVADHEGEVRLTEFAGEHRVHPRATALRLARVPIRVEGAEMAAGGGVVDLVEGGLGVPGFGERLSIGYWGLDIGI